MFDNDDYLSNLMNLSSTTTENSQTEQQTEYGSQTGYSTQGETTPYSNYERDDYSSAQNFTEQQSYNPTMSSFETKEVKTNQMSTPMIEKSEETFNLVKKQSRIYFETRMKIVLAMFMVIVACLTFVSVYNFVKAGKIQSTFADKEIQIKNLKQSITDSKVTYTLMTGDEYVKEWAENNNYVEKNEENSVVIYLDEMYEEPTIQEIPSNWFNDVCEFFSKLFA